MVEEIHSTGGNSFGGLEGIVEQSWHDNGGMLITGDGKHGSKAHDIFYDVNFI